jgi:hypothetical protein
MASWNAVNMRRHSRGARIRKACISQLANCPYSGE